MVKIPAGAVDGFVDSPDPAIAAVLFYGPDPGLVAERGRGLTTRVAGDPGDPFRVGELTFAALREDPARLADEVTAQSLTGGRRVVRLRGAGDGAHDALAGIIADLGGDPAGGALLVVEAGDLGPRSKLRRLFERAANGAALPCYRDDERTVAALVRASLDGHGLTVAPDALRYLVDHLGGDRAVTRGELEKLALYAAGTGAVTLEDAVACVGDSAALALDAAAFAATQGDFAALERAFARLAAEGTPPVALLRGTLHHVRRLHLAAGLIAAGRSPEQAMAALRPPVFFKAKPRFRAQLGLWNTARLAESLDVLLTAERACKRTAMPAATLAQRALMSIANAASRQRRRGTARR